MVRVGPTTSFGRCAVGQLSRRRLPCMPDSLRIQWRETLGIETTDADPGVDTKIRRFRP